MRRWIISNFSRAGWTLCAPRGAIACSPISSGMPATFRAPSTTISATKSRSGARTIISAWASIPTCWPRCTRRSTVPAPARAARATFPARCMIMCCLERELADLHGSEAALVFTSGYVANEAALSTIAGADARLHHFLRRAQPCLDDPGHPPQRRREAHLPAQRSGRSRPAAVTAADPARPKLVCFESVYSMDGDIAPIAEICDVADRTGR